MEEKGIVDNNKTEGRFTKDRTRRCEDLMRPEIKPLLNFSLDDKISVCSLAC